MSVLPRFTRKRADGGCGCGLDVLDDVESDDAELLEFHGASVLRFDLFRRSFVNRHPHVINLYAVARLRRRPQGKSRVRRLRLLNRVNFL